MSSIQLEQRLLERLEFGRFLSVSPHQPQVLSLQVVQVVYVTHPSNSTARHLADCDCMIAALERQSVRAPGLAAALTTLAVGLAGCAGQRAFPDAPILIVCPWAAGG